MSTVHPPPARSPACGHTLIESLFVLALVAVLLKTLLPSWTEHQARRRVEAASAQLLADLELLRASALAGDEVLRVSFHSGVDGSCWLLHSGEPAQCSCSSLVNGRPTPQCTTGARLLQARSWSNRDLLMRANIASLRVDPRLGNMSPSGSIELSAAGLPPLRHVVNLLGRVRLCSVVADPVSPRWPGVGAC
ncbi:hypothetical protein ACWA7J_00645 [Leptothrix sp. BB-4]